MLRAERSSELVYRGAWARRLWWVLTGCFEPRVGDVLEDRAGRRHRLVWIGGRRFRTDTCRSGTWEPTG